MLCALRSRWPARTAPPSSNCWRWPQPSGWATAAANPGGCASCSRSIKATLRPGSRRSAPSRQGAPKEAGRERSRVQWTASGRCAAANAARATGGTARAVPRQWAAATDSGPSGPDRRSSRRLAAGHAYATSMAELHSHFAAFAATRPRGEASATDARAVDRPSSSLSRSGARHEQRAQRVAVAAQRLIVCVEHSTALPRHFDTIALRRQFTPFASHGRRRSCASPAL